MDISLLFFTIFCFVSNSIFCKIKFLGARQDWEKGENISIGEATRIDTQKMLQQAYLARYSKLDRKGIAFYFSELIPEN